MLKKIVKNYRLTRYFVFIKKICKISWTQRKKKKLTYEENYDEYFVKYCKKN